jgi:hypothetical protein
MIEESVKVWLIIDKKDNEASSDYRANKFVLR